MVSFIRSFNYLLPVVLPIILVFVSSFYDDTFRQPWRGRLSSKLCFAMITFDIWGLTVLLSPSNAAVASPILASAELATFLIILLLMHLGFHYLCLERINQRRFVWVRFFLATLSISAPMAMFVPKNLFELFT